MHLSILHFRIPDGPLSVCGTVMIDGPDEHTWLIISELASNHGQSITEAAACIASLLRKGLNLHPERTRWFAHHPPRAGSAATLHVVRFVWDARQQCFHSPNYRAATMEERAWIDWHTPLDLRGAPPAVRVS